MSHDGHMTEGEHTHIHACTCIYLAASARCMRSFPQGAVPAIITLISYCTSSSIPHQFHVSLTDLRQCSVQPSGADVGSREGGASEQEGGRACVLQQQLQERTEDREQRRRN